MAREKATDGQVCAMHDVLRPYVEGVLTCRACTGPMQGLIECVLNLKGTQYCERFPPDTPAQSVLNHVMQSGWPLIMLPNEADVRAALALAEEAFE